MTSGAGLSERGGMAAVATPKTCRERENKKEEKEVKKEKEKRGEKKERRENGKKGWGEQERERCIY